MEFYQHLFTESPVQLDEAIFDVIPPLVSPEDNDQLCTVPSALEVWEAVKGMDGDSAPGPDGYTGWFFTSCWEIIQQDVTEAVQSFFQTAFLPRGYTSSQLVLIPKVAKPVSLSDFCPISLCNFSYKIIAKIMASRLARLLPSLISEEQAGFVPGRSIHENIALAHEMIYDLDRTSEGDNLVVKLDMNKAYDRVNWDFLYHTLRRFGFSQQFTSLIDACISNCHYTVNFQGLLHGFFKSGRGVRQGDPISPTLFILAQEVFSRNWRQAVVSGAVTPYKCFRTSMIVSHLLYADDMLLFLNGSKRSIEAAHSVISQFERSSGQQISLEKSCFIAPSACSVTRRNLLTAWWHFPAKSLPLNYLGAPLFKGCSQIAYS